MFWNAQVPKLLTTKKDTELVREAPTIQTGLGFLLSLVPSQRIAAYHPHTTAWAQVKGNTHTNLVRTRSKATRATSGNQSCRREPRAPKNRSEAASGVNPQGWGRKRATSANTKNT